jgi:coatomer protein complex subunit alpha (xenin)
LDILISNSEDFTTMVWDLGSRSAIETYKKEPERFWVVAVHPVKNYMATGHDSGLAKFCLIREHVCI